MAYDVVAYKVRELAQDSTGGLPGGVVTLSLPDIDVPPVPLILLIDQATVVCTQAGNPIPCALYDRDPTQGNPPPPVATTVNGNLDQGESAGGIVIPSGGNLFIQWTGVAPGAQPRARVQFRLANPINVTPAVPQSHPILAS